MAKITVTTTIGNNQEIKEFPIKYFLISKLKFDKENPNDMTEEEMNGLRESFKRFGDLNPAVVDQKLRIVDGEHRIKVLKEFGRTKARCIQRFFKNDTERRLFRQVANKLRGTHNPAKDSNEILEIMRNKELESLAVLIAKPQEDLSALIEMFHKEDSKTDELASTMSKVEEAENKEFTSEIQTANQCPKCGYKY